GLARASGVRRAERAGTLDLRQADADFSRVQRAGELGALILGPPASSRHSVSTCAGGARLNEDAGWKPAVRCGLQPRDHIPDHVVLTRGGCWVEADAGVGGVRVFEGVGGALEEYDVKRGAAQALAFECAAGLADDVIVLRDDSGAAWREAPIAAA